MAKKGRKLKEWTAQEIEQLEALAAYGLSMERMAALFYIEEDGVKRPMSKDTLERYRDADHRISAAIEKGRSDSESQVAQMAFMVAMGRKEVIENGQIIEKAVAPNPAMIMFWLKCRARWSETQNINVSPGGADEGKSWSDVMLDHDKSIGAALKTVSEVEKPKAKKKPAKKNARTRKKPKKKPRKSKA